MTSGCGALHVFVDGESDYDNVYPEAIIGNRTMLVEPRKIRAAIDSRDAP